MTILINAKVIILGLLLEADHVKISIYLERKIQNYKRSICATIMYILRLIFTSQ